MVDSLLERARGGDEAAFAELVFGHRRELHLHCYRMLGSISDADDLVQDTMLAAWRGIAGFAGRSSLRSWLYRIATNRCLNAIRDAKRRPPPAPVPPFEPPEPSRWSEVTWIQPYPDAWLGPAERCEAHEAVELAFIVALQHLPPRQTAVVVLCDVLGFSVAEAAAMLDVGPTTIKGLLQRARASLDRLDLTGARPSGEAAEVDLVRRFATAFGDDDVEGVVALLTDDAWLAMPPAPHEYHGVEAIARFLGASAAGRAGQRLGLLPTRANGQPAFVCYLEAPVDPILRPSGVVVLTVSGNHVAGITRFLDPALPTVFGFDNFETLTGARDSG
ncbi:MAG: RNA polymerase subunit sigma-70 [Acidimicrobiales bacterium]